MSARVLRVSTRWKVERAGCGAGIVAVGLEDFFRLAMDPTRANCRHLKEFGKI